ncbi:DUF4132 domain-containing protein [Nocardia sp. NPDC127579]|uniref:DUF4132 domain-containing protein n=1 Tax=Nocardia sp. NPDC127579 TaxID=3345402 RepID=UPI00362D64F1
MTPQEFELESEAAEVPRRWWAKAEPFRGLGVDHVATVDAAAVAAMAARLRDSRAQIEAILAHPNTDAETAARGRAYLSAPADASPQDAAVIGLTLLWSTTYGFGSELADYLVATHGFSYAAATLTAMSDLSIGDPRRPGMVWSSWVGPLSVWRAPSYGSSRLAQSALRRLRALLAAAPAADYTATRARLAAMRTGARVDTEQVATTNRLEDRPGCYPDSQHPGLALEPNDVRHGADHRAARLAPPGPDDDTDADGTGCTDIRGGGGSRDLVATFLLPTEQDWVAADIAALTGSARGAANELAVTRLLACVRTAEQARSLIEMVRPSMISWWPELTHSLGVQLGLDCPEVLVRLYRRIAEAKPRRRVVAMLRQLDTVEALTALLELRGGPYVQPAILEVAAHAPRRALWVFGSAADAEQVREHIRRHPDAGRAAAKCVLPRELSEILSQELSDIDRADVAPEILVPEILRTPPWLRPRAKPRVVTGLEPPAELLCEWYSYKTLDPDLVRLASPLMLRLAIRALDRRTLRATAVEWFRLHHGLAVPLLIPAAVGPTGRERTDAGSALRILVDLGFRDEILATARTYGADAYAVTQEVLDADPATLVPTRIPKLPEWLSLTALPPLTVADGAHTLPLPAVGTVFTMTMLSQPGAPYPALAQVKSACDPAALAAAAWEVYEQWRRSGAHTRDAWVWEAVGGLGDEDTVNRLLDLVRADSADQRAVSALDALVAIGSDAALLALKTVSEKVKTKRVREGARARLSTIADRLGLSADQLADRLVPDLGLRADGTVQLDFGPRQFVVGFDEQLRPTIHDSTGTRRAALPKPGLTDDPELAPAAVATFRKLKKNATALGADQIVRLERAMVAGRRFALDELTSLFVAHPLRGTITRRIVWGVYEGTALVRSFRVAEDGSFADLADDGLHLPADASIGVAHPIDLGAAVQPWASVFADYELLQPFEQLARAVFPDADEAAVTAFGGRAVESARILGLPRRGWLRPETEDGGNYFHFTKPLPHDGSFVLTVTPIMHAACPADPPIRTIESTTLRAPVRSPVTGSELVRDLTWLTTLP